MVFVSLGCDCRPSYHLRRRGEHFKFPLDFAYTPTLEGAVSCVINDWEGVFDVRPSEEPQSEPYWVSNRYGIRFVHEGKGTVSELIERVQPAIDLFREHQHDSLTFVRIGGREEKSQPLLDHFPNARFLLVNYGDYQRVKWMNRIFSWLFPPELPGARADQPSPNNPYWEIAFNEISSMADSAGRHAEVDRKTDAWGDGTLANDG